MPNLLELHLRSPKWLSQQIHKLTDRRYKFWFNNINIVLYPYHMTIYFNMLHPHKTPSFVQCNYLTCYHNITSSEFWAQNPSRSEYLVSNKFTCKINRSLIFWFGTWSRDDMTQDFSNKYTITYSRPPIDWTTCPSCIEKPAVRLWSQSEYRSLFLKHF